MRLVRAATVIAGAAPDRVWSAVACQERLGDLVEGVLAVVREPNGDTRWTVLLNGSQVEWVQRESAVELTELRFTQVSGDFDELTGAWRLSAEPGGVRLSLELQFHLGVDGLAPLLDPVWAQSLQAHADALVRAVAQRARTADK